jgi:hypothetical protein
MTSMPGVSKPLLSLFPTSEISLPFSIFPNYFLPFFSLFYTYSFFPFLFYLLLSLSSSTLSHLFLYHGFPGWWTYGSSPPSISSHHESDEPPCYSILSQFYDCGFSGWRDRTLILPCSVMYILHQKGLLSTCWQPNHIFPFVL